jgi:glycosyltransferase involved in cell wall biosynthesis
VHATEDVRQSGTAVLERAVEQLRSEGMQLDYLRLEGASADTRRRALLDADIFVEQLVTPMYGTGALEAMAMGRAVLSNVGGDATRVFRQFSFLDECPVVDTDSETIRPHLRRLVGDPELRRTLGAAGRAYAAKHHDYASARALFAAIEAHHSGTSRGPALLDLYHPTHGAAAGEQRIAVPLVAGRP